MRARRLSTAILALLLSGACSARSLPLDGERPDAGMGAVASGWEPVSPSPAQSASTDASAQSEELDAGDPARDRVDEPPVDAQEAADALPASQRDAAPEDAAAFAAPYEDAGRPPHSPTAVYSAQRYIGGTERVTITKRDPGKAHCLQLITAFPAFDGEPPDIEQPPMWLTRLYAVAVAPDGTCALGSDAPEWQFSTKETGRLAWRELGAHGQPCRADLDIEVSFMPTSRIPARDHFLVENLAIPCD